jgi:hypothetical protein
VEILTYFLDNGAVTEEQIAKALAEYTPPEEEEPEEAEAEAEASAPAAEEAPAA